MSRPTAARIAKRKRQAEARRAKRQARTTQTAWPVGLPGRVPPAALMLPLLGLPGQTDVAVTKPQPRLLIDVTYADPPRVYRPLNRPTSTGP